MEKEKEIIANWSYDLYVQCPKCNHYFDIKDEWQDKGMWEVCNLLENKNITEYEFEVECPECKDKFRINEVIY